MNIAALCSNECMTAKLDKLQGLIAPGTEEEVRERMRAYEAEPSPGFVAAENEIYDREMRNVGPCQASADFSGANRTTVAAIRDAEAGKVDPINLDDL